MSKKAAARKFAAYVLPPLLWMAFIFPVGNRAFASSRIYEVFVLVVRWLAPRASGPAVAAAYIVFRKTLHFIEYGLLAYLLYRAFRGGRGPHWSRRAGLLAAGAAIAYGFVDEFLQSFVRGRYGSPFDWAVDTAGILATVGLLARTGKRRDADPLGPAGRLLWLKRPFDVALSGLGLLVSLPLWIVIPLAVRLEDGGPAFYAQERVGLGGRTFKALKFRSMVRDAEKGSGPVQAVAGDPRVTRAGRVLRATAMDELPQLVNIFKGDMSFVGPRALRPNEKEVNGGAEAVPIAGIPGYEARHAVRPGLTGLTQVFLPGETPRRKKFRCDLLYIRKRSFGLDLRLIALSFWITLRGKWESRQPKV
ncbi:MAG TPA: VanZ family protein [Candidatus Aminicenantes bacterium]|nr:VanZ family protein [Candidatus Aminicenantes bacterium]